ncbi:pyrroloquinoline quinone biosynthesis protein PqqE [Streptacidiphilus sp. EB129]|uniref:pyrroloquinoline quinone biosynthesis protein PqqE n=1 Tax=Streptacidiphilus sp. EB129 TaxID=3156262 RepID=UPI00351966D9
MADVNHPAPPWAMLAELTHACPLQCGYCSNPVELIRRGDELTTDQWCEVLAQAGRLGVVQAHLSGGEPLLRPDLEQIVAAAEQAGIHTQLVTSGVGLTAPRLDALARAGLGSVQLSVQHADPASSDRIAGRRSFADKERAAAVIRACGLPFGLNVVLHRENLDALDAIVELALSWGADRIELANAQFYGWALLNRGSLLPSRAQLRRAVATVEAWRTRLDARFEGRPDARPQIVWVVPDYFEGVAKPCMGGWGSVSLTVTPDGTVLPCATAASIPGLDPPNVKDRSLAWAWNESHAFNAYRGTEWMTGPCGGCPRRSADFGGCRCQAFALTGDAARTDPACGLSPDHGLIRDLVPDTGDGTPVARSYRSSADLRRSHPQAADLRQR